MTLCRGILIAFFIRYYPLTKNLLLKQNFVTFADILSG